MQTNLWIAQRVSAAVLAICVFVHLATIIYAVQGGLTGLEILGRTRGHAGWLAFYCVFVIAVSIHAPIGLRSVLREWLSWSGRSCDLALLALAGLILFTGIRAAVSVFA